MAPDRTILHLVNNKKIPDPLPLSRIIACTLLSLNYALRRSRRSVCFICLFTLELAFSDSHVLRFVDSGLIIGITSNRVCLILSESFPTPFASVGNFNKFIALSNLVLDFSDFFPYVICFRIVKGPNSMIKVFE